MPMKDRRTCASCRWRCEDDGLPGDLALCRVRAPVASGGIARALGPVWPIVAKTDWCGDHAPARSLRLPAAMERSLSVPVVTAFFVALWGAAAIVITLFTAH